MKLYRITLNYDRHFYVEASDQVEALTLFMNDRRDSVKDDGHMYRSVSVEYVGSVIRDEKILHGG